MYVGVYLCIFCLLLYVCASVRVRVSMYLCLYAFFSHIVYMRICMCGCICASVSRTCACTSVCVRMSACVFVFASVCVFVPLGRRVYENSGRRCQWQRSHEAASIDVMLLWTMEKASAKHSDQNRLWRQTEATLRINCRRGTLR